MPDPHTLDPEERRARWKEHRTRFLRKRHRSPLRQRLEEVLGPQYADQAISLAKDLSDPWVRDKLRAMVRTIPENDHHRRWRYFVRCCEVEGVFEESKAKEMEAAEEAERVLDVMEEDDRREAGKEEIRRLHRLAAGPRQYGFGDLVALVGMKLAQDALDVIFDRCRDIEIDPDSARRDFSNICTLARQARNPRRYVMAIIRNARKPAPRRGS